MPFLASSLARTRRAAFYLFISGRAGLPLGLLALATLAAGFAHALFVGRASAFIGGAVAASRVVAFLTARLARPLAASAATIAGRASLGVGLPLAAAGCARLAVLGSG